MIEQSLIGALTKFPNELPALHLRPEHFEDPFCSRALSAMFVIVRNGHAITPMEIARIMGGDELINLATLKLWRDEIPSKSPMAHWANILRSNWRTKQVRKILSEYQDAPGTGDEIRGKVITELAAIEDDGKNHTTSGQDWMEKVVEKLEETYDARRNGGIVGVRTGLREMDDILGGFHNSDLIIMGARPKMGKTAWLVNAAKSAAMSGKRVGIASAEMPAYQLGQRLLSDVAGVPASVFRSGLMNDAQFHAMSEGTATIAELPIMVFDKPGMTPTDIALQTRAWQMSTGIDILFVDYLQRLVAGPEYANQSRALEVAKMVASLKTLALTMNIPVVCLAQVNRDCESRADKRPMPSDLKESGAIEQEADVIMFLYRDSVYNKNADPHMAEILIEANRHGPTGIINCVFDGEYMRWASNGSNYAKAHTAAEYRATT